MDTGGRVVRSGERLGCRGSLDGAAPLPLLVGVARRAVEAPEAEAEANERRSSSCGRTSGGKHTLYTDEYRGDAVARLIPAESSAEERTQTIPSAGRTIALSSLLVVVEVEVGVLLVLRLTGAAAAGESGG